jgi:transposase
VIAPYLPAERPGRRGRPRIWPLRRIVEAILYLDRAGCAWRYLPADFPPWQTVYGYFAAWRDDGTLARLHHELRAQVRAAAGRSPQPTAAVIDSQSVRAADTVPKATRGWDNAKKVNGRKRHIAVDVTGLVLDVVITAASVQDRDAARPLLWNTSRACRRVRLVWADAGYAGKLVTWAATLKMTLQIVAKRNPHAFEVLPRRWVVERTFAWISKHRRTVRDYEHLPASHEAMILWAMVALMTRRLAQPAHLSDAHLEPPGPPPILLILSSFPPVIPVNLGHTGIPVADSVPTRTVCRQPPNRTYRRAPPARHDQIGTLKTPGNGPEPVLREVGRRAGRVIEFMF